jgi:hypothetical protein
MSSTPNNNLTREDLPDSLVSAKTMALGQYNPIELRVLAARPQNLTEFPKGKYSPSTEKRLRNLAQYRGRSPEGQRNALANLRRRMKIESDSQPPALPPGTPTPEISLQIPPENYLSAIKKRYAKSVLSKEEYDLFMAEWVEWMTGHPELRESKADRDDVQKICMEKALQWRYQLLMASKPKEDFSGHYDESCKREADAKKSLAVRRLDREGTARTKTPKKVVNNNNFNVAVMAGEVDARQLDELKAGSAKEIVADYDAIECSIGKNNALEVIDAEIIQEGLRRKDEDLEAAEAEQEKGDAVDPNGDVG